MSVGLLERANAARDELIGGGPETRADGESMVELRTQIARLEAYCATATARLDADRAWASDGADEEVRLSIAVSIGQNEIGETWDDSPFT